MYSVNKFLTWIPSVVFPEYIFSGRFSCEFWIFLWNTCWNWKRSLYQHRFISFAKVIQSKACQYYCWNTFKLDVNFLIQNTRSSFQTATGTFNRVLGFCQHTIKNFVYQIYRIRLLSYKIKSEGRLGHQLDS